MFRTYTLDCHAANPQMPLEPVCPYTGSAATFVLVNLPRPHGKQRIDAVTLSITNADAAVSAHPATREGSSWIVTVPAAAIGPAGNVREAIIISASGVDEQNRPVPSWIVAVADLRVRHQDGTAVPGEPRVLVSWFSARPANPRGVFICPNPESQTALDFFDGQNYRPLVGGSTIDAYTKAETDALLAEKRGKYDLGVYKWVFTCDHPTIKFFSLNLTGGAGWTLRGGESADSMRLLATLGGDEFSVHLEGYFNDDDDIDWDIVCDRSEATDELATKTEVAAKLDADDPVLTPTAPSATASETALAGAKATGTALAGKADSVDIPQMAKDAMSAEGISSSVINIGGNISGATVSDQYGNLRDAIASKLDADKVFDGDEISDDFVSELMRNQGAISAIDARLPYPINTAGTILDRHINNVTSGAFVIPEGFHDLLIRYTGVPASLTFSGTDASIADYGDDLPTETGDYLVTVTRTKAAECYIRIVTLEARA